MHVDVSLLRLTYYYQLQATTEYPIQHCATNHLFYTVSTPSLSDVFLLIHWVLKTFQDFTLIIHRLKTKGGCWLHFKTQKGVACSTDALTPS